MRPLHIRTQAEILDRIYEAIKRGDVGDEVHEYMRCAKFIPLILRRSYEDTTEEDWSEPEMGRSDIVCDDARQIDEVARKMLPVLLDQVTRRPMLARTVLNQFRAWKWLLGHIDADDFLKERTIAQAARALEAQITSREWEVLTKNAKRKSERTPAHEQVVSITQ